MYNLKHKNIIKLYDHFEDNECIYLILGMKIHSIMLQLFFEF